MKIVIFGLTITSSWGNGHGTTYRSLVKALARLGHHVDFVEKDVEWYRSNRDMPQPAFCTVHLYENWAESSEAMIHLCRDAEAVIIGSYFPDAIAVTDELLHSGIGPLLFYDIDTPITMAQLRAQGRTEYLEASAIPHYAAYLSFTGGPALRELEDTFGSPCAVPFYCSVDPDLYRPVPPHSEFACDLSYLGTYAPDRQPKLMRLLDNTAALLPERRFIVAGPQYPADANFRTNVERIIHLSPREHPAFYSSSRFTLNLTRADMVAAGYSPSVRLFEASACGAALISDDWKGLAEFLTPSEEILLPHDECEVADILRNFPEDGRKRLGARARERILSEHTSIHRAQQFEKIVAHCYAARG
ncbi:MAG TPA: glycosyltransferase [Acidobacteriaceae bacterium]|nr:glycosyltransferase [Acidobacteriaceae bacterium]